MPMLNQDTIREATRLTRAGQLVEATLLLQRMLRGESTPDAPMRSTGHTALKGREPLTIDVTPNAVEERDMAPRAKATSVAPRVLRARLDRARESPGLGLHGVMKRAPLSTRDIVPEGARFIDGTYSNAAGTRAYKLFLPDCDHGQPRTRAVMLQGC